MSALPAEVAELYAAYADCLDEGELERWPDFFCRDALYRITSRENHDHGLPLALMRCEGRAGLADRVTAIRRTSVFRPRAMRLLLGTPHVVRGGDAGPIESRATFVACETIAGEETRLFLAGRSYDTLAHEEGRLRFRSRLCVFDSQVVPGSLIYPL